MTEPPPRTVEPDEVLPPESAGGPSRPSQGPTRPRLTPVVAGLVLDAIDLATLGPVGIWMGIPLGATAAWFLSDAYDLPWKRRVAISAAAGLYCAIPFTSPLPLGTALGLLLSRTSEPRG